MERNAMAHLPESSDTPPTDSSPTDDTGHDLVEPAMALVGQWLSRAEELETKRERSQAARLDGVVSDEAGVRFAMRFVDRVIRPEDHRVAAEELVALVRDRGGEPLPGFLSPIDKVLLQAGARLAPVIPQVVMPLAVQRMRQVVGPLVVDADPAKMASHLRSRRAEGFRLNVNQLGEAVLGDGEAQRRFEKADRLLDDPDVDYVSVKTSSIVSQLNYWAWDDSLTRVIEQLRPLFTKARDRGTFINLDMEEYHDLELTVAAFRSLLDEPELADVDAGIVLQAYLPDSFPVLQALVAWAEGRPGTIKIRLVKGANLAMEKVEAAMHDWPQAPYHTKAEVDANYKRCLDWVLTPEHTRSVRIGLASHNLFDTAWGYLLASERGVADRLELEMLQGMAVPQAKAARETAGDLLLYTPVVAASEFDVAISYLFRRLEENASDANFIRHLFTLRPGSPEFESEAGKFRRAVADRHTVTVGPNRGQNRLTDEPPGEIPDTFVNEPDTDPALAANRRWAADVVRAERFEPIKTPLLTDSPEQQTPSRDAHAHIDDIMAELAQGAAKWSGRPAAERRAILHAVADELTRRRGDLINAMIHEAKKTLAQADPEVSEAIDFARYYAERIDELDQRDGLRFEPFGVVTVVPPWNFPVAIPAGGVLAALAAGNTVAFKPAPQTPRCAEIVTECCWAAGVPDDALQFIRVPDDDLGRHLIEASETIILTGAYETAELFRSWKPSLRILAETSGKNAMIVTPHADLDLAVADLAYSAFGHAGQKCSAASIGILVGDVYHSERFRRQLVDAVTSLTVGPSTDLSTDMSPTIEAPSGKLLRGLTVLDEGEEWLIEPRRLDDGPTTATWSPGIRLGVKPGSWFHQTECFGPVLGLMAAADLDEALAIQNGTTFGLTGGIHSLDPNEIDEWIERIQVGNAYVNRSITGAIVQRQPFGGWRRSSIGPGAKAGGPNYVAQLGRWVPDAEGGTANEAAEEFGSKAWLAAAIESDTHWWATEFSVEHDPTRLFCESNVFRYRALERVAVRVERSDRTTATTELERVLAAARRCGVATVVSDSETESTDEFAAGLGALAARGVTRIRLIGSPGSDSQNIGLRNAANAAGIHVADDPITANGRVELLHYLREQAVSRTLHRYGNLL
ncbi:MAG: bifunctional proline dehydrogenase/L-glutamate gamma-semialdehyde dehydrogenase [Acidimicrobiia bacterium]|nr:bifunctional proline dehydrogenase/L-glutamate gamma-semialdehyde dehydrogenase [Acidimicrobiia bacterium]